MRWLVSTEEARAARLAGVHRFSSLTPRQMLTVVRSGRLVRLQQGEEVLRQGDPTRGVWIVLTGLLSIRWHGQEIGQVTTGDVVGEISMVVGQEHSATVVALTECEAIHLDPATATAVADAIPTFATALVDIAYERRDGDLAAGRRTPRPQTPRN